MGAVQRAGMHRERSELGCRRRRGREKKAGEGDFSLDEVMDDGLSQSES